MNSLPSRLRSLATAEGFSHCQFCAAVDSPGFADLVRWIDAGFAGQMNYFAARLDAYRHPRGVLPGARTIAVLAVPYPAADPPGDDRHVGKIARYAWSGDDYHDQIHAQLKRICRTLATEFPGVNARGIVDTAPLMEREVAELAGIGWRGKNTLLLNQQLGSYFFLACVLLDVEIDSRELTPQTTSHCGTCTACLDACPTDAFVSAGVLDATRCVSYLTIESREMPPEELRSGIGDWLFGCDVCQEVCPWNRKPARRANQLAEDQHASDDSTRPLASLDPVALLTLDDDAFRQRFRQTPMWRSRRRGMIRNAAIVLGNRRDRSAIEPLRTLLSDPEPLVREAVAWALMQIIGDEITAESPSSDSKPDE